MRSIGILAGVAQSASLSKQVPALIELHLDRIEPRLPVIVKLPAAVQLLFLVHQLLDVVEHVCVRCGIGHRSSLSWPDAGPRLRLWGRLD